MLHLFSAWNRLHPIIVHFPVILLLVAPVLVILGSSFLKPTENHFSDTR